jgi:hypothetical protein
METSVVVATISAVTSVLGAAVSFFFSMRKEKEADWRKIKFEHYREFMGGLSGIVGTDASQDGHRRFAQVCHTIQLIASKQVIKALHNFRNEIAVSNPHRTQEKHDELLSVLIRTIRADLGISPASNPDDLSIRLWLSGVDHEALSRSARDLRQGNFATDAEVKATFARYQRGLDIP